MKKIAVKIFIIFALLISFVSMSANAYINSEYDVTYKRNQLQSIAQQDFLSFINKTELIGYRLDNFNIYSSQYKYQINLAMEKLNGVIKQISVINSSSEISDSEKQIQLNRLYQEANNALYEVDNQTMNYIYNVRVTMPTITYQKYVKTFMDFYNSIQLTDAFLMQPYQ